MAVISRCHSPFVPKLTNCKYSERRAQTQIQSSNEEQHAVIFVNRNSGQARLDDGTAQKYALHKAGSEIRRINIEKTICRAASYVHTKCKYQERRAQTQIQSSNEEQHAVIFVNRNSGQARLDDGTAQKYALHKAGSEIRRINIEKTICRAASYVHTKCKYQEKRAQTQINSPTTPPPKPRRRAPRPRNPFFRSSSP